MSDPTPMSAEEVRVAVAESVGWRIANPENKRLDYRHWIPPGQKEVPGVIYGDRPPNYPNDLSAIRGVVLGILNTGSSQMNWDYCEILGEVTGSGDHVTTALVFASAEQHCTALLRFLEQQKGASHE